MNKRLWLFILSLLLVTSTAQAQLDKVFGNIFDRVLRQDLQLIGEHGTHFLEAAAEANRVLTPGLNALIASNVSSFPLTSTIAGVTYDLSSGRPVKITESLGPIFAETAATLGKSKLNVGFEYTHLSLEKFRGLRTQDLRFTFNHLDLKKDGQPLGDDVVELDVMDVNLDLDANANIFAFFATLGLASNLDVGVAIPLITTSLSGEAMATLRGPFAGVLHTFKGGTTNSPNLVDRIPYDESGSGVGDIAVRVKYNFVRGSGMNWAALLDVRLPTGDEADFLGTGKTSTRLSLIATQKIAQFTPHLNIGYDRRPAALDSDELEFAFGFDQKMAEGVTFAVDFLGEIDINSDEAITFFPQETVTIVDKTNAPVVTQRTERLTNIITRDNDNIFNASFGLRVAASEKILLLGNVVVPLNDGGLRSNVVPTFGATVSF
jgi:hypothetical protein